MHLKSKCIYSSFLDLYLTKSVYWEPILNYNDDMANVQYRQYVKI